MDTVKELYGPLKVGGDTLAYCTRCKIELGHVIVSMVANRPAKVICKTCKAQHNYKRIGDIGQRSKGKSTSKAPKVTTTIKMSELWEKRIAESKATPRAYDIKLTYQKGELVQHPKFGLGIVEAIKSGSKMSVLFRDDERTLMQAFAG